jgi:hypothetical protein
MGKNLEFFTPEAFKKSHDDMVERCEKEWERVKHRIDLAKRYNELLNNYKTDNEPTPEESLALHNEMNENTHHIEGDHGQCVFFDCELIGYWKSDFRDTKARKEEAEKLIDKEWAKTFRAKYIIRYMQAGYKTTHYMGYANNALWDKSQAYELQCLGTNDMMSPDGKYQYPEKWWIYVEQYGVKPDDEQFIKDATMWCRFPDPKECCELMG